MKKVFLLTHVHKLPNSEEDLKFIGVYATLNDAEAAVERAKKRAGFADCINGFFIESHNIGEDQWLEGFVTWTP